MVEMYYTLQTIVFDRTRKDAIARKRVNGSRKFPLQLYDRRHEMIDTLFRLE